MISESSTSDVLLTGQTAYTKKTGTMLDNGVITVNTPNSEATYSGYIAEGSKLKAVTLEDTTEYKECDDDMKLALGEDYVTGENLSVIENTNNIKTSLEEYSNKVQTIVNNIYTYKTTKFKVPEVITPAIELKFPISTTLKFYIQPDTSETEYDILVSTDNKFKIHYKNGSVYVNDALLSEEDITIERIDNTFYINNISLDIEDVTEDFVLLPETNAGFTGIMGSLIIYGDTTIHKLVPVVKINVGSILLDEETNKEYNINIKTMAIYEKANIWSKSLYTDIYMTPSTGIELQFANYSSSSSSDTYIFGTGVDATITGCFNMFLRRVNSNYQYGRSVNVNTYTSTSVSCTAGSSTIVNMKMNVQNSGQLVFSNGVSGTYNLTKLSGNSKSRVPLAFPGYTDGIDRDKNIKVNDTNFYYCKVYEGQNLIADLRMAKTIDNVSVVFDDITKKVYTKGKASISCSGSVTDWR